MRFRCATALRRRMRPIFSRRCAWTVQRTATLARCRSVAGLADPRDDPQVLPLEAAAGADRERGLAERRARPITPRRANAGRWIASVEREQMVREAIGQLPARCREMIELLFFEQPPLPYTEVARAPQPGPRFHRVHSRALPEAAQEGSWKRKGSDAVAACRVRRADRATWPAEARPAAAPPDSAIRPRPVAARRRSRAYTTKPCAACTSISQQAERMARAAWWSPAGSATTSPRRGPARHGPHRLP